MKIDKMMNIAVVIIILSALCKLFINMYNDSKPVPKFTPRNRCQQLNEYENKLTKEEWDALYKRIQ